MNNNETVSIKSKEALTTEECLEKAERFINKSGVCLFLFDVQNSKQYQPRQELQDRLFSLIQELNTEFDNLLPENQLSTSIRTEKGFYSLLGDGSWAGINHSEAVPKIISYINNNYSDISFRYDIAEDGFDEENLKILK